MKALFVMLCLLGGSAFAQADTETPVAPVEQTEVTAPEAETPTPPAPVEDGTGTNISEFLIEAQ